MRTQHFTKLDLRFSCYIFPFHRCPFNCEIYSSGGLFNALSFLFLCASIKAVKVHLAVPYRTSLVLENCANMDAIIETGILTLLYLIVKKYSQTIFHGWEVTKIQLYKLLSSKLVLRKSNTS